MRLLRLTGWLGVAGSLTFVALLFLTHDGRELPPAPFYFALIGIAAASLATVAHLKLSPGISEEEKRVWRRRLWWAGPLAAACYLIALDDK